MTGCMIGRLWWLTGSSKCEVMQTPMGGFVASIWFCGTDIRVAEKSRDMSTHGN